MHLSKCCKAKTHVHTSWDEIDREWCTNYYVCNACGQACDLAKWSDVF